MIHPLTRRQKWAGSAKAGAQRRGAEVSYRALKGCKLLRHISGAGKTEAVICRSEISTNIQRYENPRAREGGKHGKQIHK